MILSKEDVILLNFKFNSKLVAIHIPYYQEEKEAYEEFKLHIVCPNEYSDEEIKSEMWWVDWGDVPAEVNVKENIFEGAFTVEITEISDVKNEEDLFILPFYLGIFSDYYNWVDLCILDYLELKAAKSTPS
jgi:hypothetical protein